MATVKAFIRTTKTNKVTNVRFRLSAGRGKQYFHVSEIMVDPANWDEKKESLKTNVLVRQDERKKFNMSVLERKEVILRVYEGCDERRMNSDVLNSGIENMLNPDFKTKNREFLACLKKYVQEWKNSDAIGKSRIKSYEALIGDVSRFLLIKKMEGVGVGEIDKKIILDFLDFLKDEFKIVDKYPEIYEKINWRKKPKDERSKNTISMKLKSLQAFFNEAESDDLITVSPFRKLGKLRSSIMKEQYDDPVFLKRNEYMRILNVSCTEGLRKTRDMFIIHCCFGCRFGDFTGLTIGNIGIEDGVLYVYYYPKKTINKGDVRKPIKTPIIKTAYDIMMKYIKGGLSLPFNEISNKIGQYNDSIKKLLKAYDITRTVNVYDQKTGELLFYPLCDVGSSKLARKTHVDMMNKVQINMYAAGLHKEGSEAVKRYTHLSISDRFKLMNAAFGTPEYDFEEIKKYLL